MIAQSVTETVLFEAWKSFLFSVKSKEKDEEEVIKCN